MSFNREGVCVCVCIYLGQLLNTCFHSLWEGCAFVSLCVCLRVRACACNAIAPGRRRCGSKQPRRADGENESHHPLSSLRTEKRREGNQSHTCEESLSPHLLISLPSPRSPLIKNKIPCSQFSAHAASLFGFTRGTAGNNWDVSQQ